MTPPQPSKPDDPTEFNPEGYDEHTDPFTRFFAYASRVGRLLSGFSRYSAYASDVGEAFRPVVPKATVNATYAISVGYVGFDVVYNGYRASVEERSVPRALAHASTFHALGSLAAPFAIIHTQVAVATKVCKKMGRFQRFGPTVAGLAWIPFLPSLVDEPIEELVHHAFHTYWPEEHHAHGLHHHHHQQQQQQKVEKPAATTTTTTNTNTNTNTSGGGGKGKDGQEPKPKPVGMSLLRPRLSQGKGKGTKAD